MIASARGLKKQNRMPAKKYATAMRCRTPARYMFSKPFATPPM